MDARTAKLLAERPKGLARLVREVRAWAKLHPSTARNGTIAAAAVLILGYYFGVWLPTQHREKQALMAIAAERLTTSTLTRQTETDSCLAKTDKESEARWKAACKKRGERAGCALPVAMTEDLERQDASARNGCLVR